MIELSTDRLTLRMFREPDLDAYTALLANPEVMRYIGDGRTGTRNEAWRHMATILGHWHLRGYGMFAVERRDNGQFVGRVGFWNPEGWPGLEIGWALLREHWGHGYATEAARACLQFGFDELQFSRVISLIHPSNQQSIRVAERLGERFEAEGELYGNPVLVYAVARDQWTGGAIGSWEDRRLR